ncbi:SAM-dependent methyltransferase [Bradyrhizobium sp. LB7.2]
MTKVAGGDAASGYASATDFVARYDRDVARRYWRHAPSGAGKHDTAELLALSDHALEEVWNDAFIKRFRQYPEEEAWLCQMANEFSGKDLLSIGSGLGFHEIYYANHGARLVCCDIVESNLRTIQRIAQIKGLPDIPVIVSGGADSLLPGEYDVVFLYGSLMAMPAQQQRELLRRSAGVLREGGRIVLMLYTWDFVRSTCSWTSKAEFDPVVFARASDPSVGEEHCPWSDWHDSAKLHPLLPAFRVVREQTWNNGWFVWFDMSASGVEPAAPFFPQSVLSVGKRVMEINPASLAADAATIIKRTSTVSIKTENNRFGYAASTASLEAADAEQPNALLIEGWIEEGGFSVGVLDELANVFVATATFARKGEVRGICRFDRLPKRYRIIFSNHRADAPMSSTFDIAAIRLIVRPKIEPPLRCSARPRERTEDPT